MFVYIVVHMLHHWCSVKVAGAQKVCTVDTQQLQGLLPMLVFAFCNFYTYHSQQTILFESEARLRLENNVLMH